MIWFYQLYLKDARKVKINRSTLRYVLKKLGYRWGRSYSGKISNAALTEKRKARQRRFFVEISQALQLVMRGTHELVCMDESYAVSKIVLEISRVHRQFPIYQNTNHFSNYIWFDPDDPNKNLVGAKAGKGERVVIFHAISLTKGLLTDMKRDDSGEIQKPFSYIEAPPTLSKKDRKSIPEARTCEWIWKANKATGDYHKNTDGQKFVFLICFDIMFKYCFCRIL